MRIKTKFAALGLISAFMLGACVLPAPSASPPVATATEMPGEVMDSDVMTGTMDAAMSDAATTEGMVFRVRIENLSGDSSVPTPFSPGVWVLHSEPGPIFITGEPNRGGGLEAQSEDANPMQLNDSLAAHGFTHGIFNTPFGGDKPGPATPGNAFQFEITATVDAPNLSFASMFGQSNDLFIGPNENGIVLFNADSQPFSGDVTDQILLWDAGSEMNEMPGEGPNQAPRQPAPNTGPADDDTTVRLVNDGYTYPTVPELVRVTIEPVDMMD